MYIYKRFENILC